MRKKVYLSFESTKKYVHKKIKKHRLIICIYIILITTYYYTINFKGLLSSHYNMNYESFSKF